VEDFKLFSDRKLGSEADAAEAKGDKGRLAALDAEWARRKELRRGMNAWVRALCFFAMWVVFTQLTAMFIAGGLIAMLNGLWIATVGIMIINELVTASRKYRV
jgi:hypothetical protein